MVKKYLYEEGMCRALGYKGQYPITYRETTDNAYKKICMACDMIDDGRCTIHKTCEIFLEAAEEIEYTWHLRDKKMR